LSRYDADAERRISGTHRASDELERPLLTVPSTNPPGPCTLSFVTDAAAQLAVSADTLRTYLELCEREWKSLAKSLRNAAKAYEEVETEAAEAISKTMNNDSCAAAVAPARWRRRTRS